MATNAAVTPDRTTAPTAATTSRPSTLEAQLRQLVPAHAYWLKNTPNAIATVQQLADKLGAQVVGVPDYTVRTRVAWSYPQGVWVVEFWACLEGNDELYHIEVTGPETTIHRSPVTVDEVTALLRALGTI